MYAIGVDYHKRYSHLTVLDGEGRVVRSGSIANTGEAVHAFVAPYGEQAEAALEATRNWTVMYDLLEEELAAVHLVHPLKVRAIAEARVKTDRIDSRILAHLLRCDLLPTAYVRPAAQRGTQQLLRQRVFFVRVRAMVKNRIHVLIDRQRGIRDTARQFSDLFGRAGLVWLRTVELPQAERALLDGDLQLLDELRARIAESDGAVRRLVASDAAMGLVYTIPGFGLFFAALVVTEIGTIARFRSAEKLWGYAGLVPSVHASGGKVFHGRLTKQGNKWLRWAAVEAVHPAIVADAELRRYYDRVRLRRGYNPAKIATARRLLAIVYQVLRDGRPFYNRGQYPRAALTNPLPAVR
jgi:transposase